MFFFTTIKEYTDEEIIDLSLFNDFVKIQPNGRAGTFYINITILEKIFYSIVELNYTPREISIFNNPHHTLYNIKISKEEYSDILVDPRNFDALINIRFGKEEIQNIVDDAYEDYKDTDIKVDEKIILQTVGVLEKDKTFIVDKLDFYKSIKFLSSIKMFQSQEDE